MPVIQLVAIADALHQIGLTILMGGMFFLLFVLRAAARDIESGEVRLAVYLGFYKRLFRWLWIALLLMWLSGIGKMLALGNLQNLPLQVRTMVGAGAAMTLLTLIAHFGFYYQMDDAVRAQHWQRAAKRGSRVRKVMVLNLLVGLLLTLLGLFGPFIAAR